MHAEEDGNKETLGNLDAILSSSQDEEQPAAQEQPKTEDDVRNAVKAKSKKKSIGCVCRLVVSFSLSRLCSLL